MTSKSRKSSRSLRSTDSYETPSSDGGSIGLTDDSSTDKKKKKRSGSVGALRSKSPKGEKEKVPRVKSTGFLIPEKTPSMRKTVGSDGKIRRSTVDSDGKIRRKKDDDAGSDDGSKRSKRSSRSRKSTKSSKSKSRVRREGARRPLPDDPEDGQERTSTVRQQVDDIEGSMAERAALEAEAEREMQERLEGLQEKIVALKQQQLDAQSEAMKLNKEKRELKLELQRSQTDGRELRAELRERDLMIKESDNRIEALEKAVESQLDKVDDLEDELRRANEEVFTLEDKLQHMEAVLAESEANVEGNGAAREKDFEAKRHERLERRLEEKEKELEARERKLRREQAKGGGGGGSSKEVEQLEQDNRMLLKALNREKDEAANLASAKDSEIERLKNKIERMHGGEGYSESAADNEKRIEQLEMDKVKVTSALKKKDDDLAHMEKEIRKLKDALNSQGGGDDYELKRDLETFKSEAAVLKSRYEGAQRQNRMLEDDIEHWKSVNFTLEDELAEWKARAARYREKAEGSRGGRSAGRSAAQMAMSRSNDSDDEEQKDGQNAISNLWSGLSALTTGTSRRPTMSSSSDMDDIISRATFH